uniref:C2H2-type domain-containing protein n=1 Tax=Aegilops tauschii subsp. strangulata TaxID=200361 RepID=A0A453GZF8_AEGTS
VKKTSPFALSCPVDLRLPHPQSLTRVRLAGKMAASGSGSVSGQIQPLKIPDAVVALAQAASKANNSSNSAAADATDKYLPGWPLFSPPKMQLTKCAKCPREFCSSVALRRHTRVHRRALKIDKDFPKNRDHLAAFWDKLTVDQAQAILSLEGVAIEETSALFILTSLSSWMCKPGYASLPLPYARAGNELLDLIQTAASRLPISSNELFIMLDEASENTFLCTNAADAACVQKFLFDGEVDKVATELKNVVACTSYILEQKLVEAWSADKAAEALRCQKLLVEEEDAAQKRQAEIIERKRMKKLRQKEQRLKDLKDEGTTVQLPEAVDGATSSPGIQSLEATSGPGLHEQEDSQYLQLSAPVPSEDNDYNGEDANCGSGQEMDTGAVFREQAMATSNLDRIENLPPNSTVSGSSATASKHPSSSSVRHSRHREPNAGAATNKSKTWAWKVRTGVEERCPKGEPDVDANQETAPLNTDKNLQVLIGSISVAIEGGGSCSEDSKDYHPAPPESDLNTLNDPVAEAMQPISHDENGCEDANAAEDHSPSSVVTDESGCDAEAAEGGSLRRGSVSSGQEAAAFLSQRWKEVMAGDHVKLVLC